PNRIVLGHQVERFFRWWAHRSFISTAPLFCSTSASKASPSSPSPTNARPRELFGLTDCEHDLLHRRRSAACRSTSPRWCRFSYATLGAVTVVLVVRLSMP